MTINYFVDSNDVDSQKVTGAANSAVNNTDKSTISNKVQGLIYNNPPNYFTCVYINGKSDPSQINNPEVSSWKYNDGTIDVRIGRPLGYFNNDGQWDDLNTDMKLTDVFPDTHLAEGDDAAVRNNIWWFVQSSDHRKNFGDDSCKFDTMVLQAFHPNGWGLLDHKYYINNPDSLSDDGPLNIMSSAKKADK